MDETSNRFVHHPHNRAVQHTPDTRFADEWNGAQTVRSDDERDIRIPPKDRRRQIRKKRISERRERVAFDLLV